MSKSRRGRQSPSPVTADELSRQFQGLDISHPKKKISRFFSKSLLNRWAAISRHDPYLNHQGQPSGDKPPPSVPQGSGQAPSTQPVYVYQPPPHPPPDPNARPSPPPYGLPPPPALIPMPEPSINYAPNNPGPTYGQPPQPGGFMVQGAYWVPSSQAPYAVPYPPASGERVGAS